MYRRVWWYDFKRKTVRHSTTIRIPLLAVVFIVGIRPVPQFRAAFASVSLPPEPAFEAVGDLPLIEVPATGPSGNLMAVHITGDGGWGVTDRGIARSLAEHGISVVGFNAFQYFWKRRTPEQTASDIDRVIRHYMSDWGKKKVILIGYSFGADVLPFVLNRLPNDTRSKIELVALLGLGQTADFEVHLLNWFTSRPRPSALPIRPELEKLRGTKILCFYGVEDRDTLCPSLEPGMARAIPLPSGHRFGHGFEPIVNGILEAVKPAANRRP